jgi:O-antigen ligase
MSGDLPLLRPYAAAVGRMPTTPRRAASLSLARKSTLGLSLFALLVVLCLFDMNTVALHIWGVTQLFSPVILVVCIALLLINRLTVYRDLGPAGRIYFLFLAAYVAIGTPIGLDVDPQGLLGRWVIVRATLASFLIVLAAAVAARTTLLAYGTKFTFRGFFALAFLIPLAIWASTYFPEFYRVPLGDSRDFSRATGSFNNPNEAGVAVCMFAAVILGFMMTDRSKVLATTLSVAALAVSALAILLTGSRGAFVIFLGVVAAQIVISPGFKKFVLMFAGGAVIAGMVYAVYNFSMLDDSAGRGQVRRMETMGRILTGDISDETTGGRFELAMNGIREWAKSPLIGNGIGSQRRVGAANIGPHNSYILIVGEAGVIPLALFLGMIATMFWQAWQCHVPAVKTFAMSYTIVLTMAGMTGHGLLVSREHAVMMGIGFGLLAACLELKAAERRDASRRPRPAVPMRAVPAVR